MQVYGDATGREVVRDRSHLQPECGGAAIALEPVSQRELAEKTGKGEEGSGMSTVGYLDWVHFQPLPQFMI